MKIELTDFEWLGEPPIVAVSNVTYDDDNKWKGRSVLPPKITLSSSDPSMTITGLDCPIRITNIRAFIKALEALITTLLLLLLPSLGWGQAVVVGEFPPPDKIKEARYTLATAEPKVLTLNVGEFEIIEPAKTLTGVPLYWHISDASIMQRIDVAANQAYGLWMKRRGEPEAKLHLFPARPVAWVILVGAKQGTSNIAIIRNGLTSSDPPAVVDTVAVTVGTPKPPPPPPDALNDFEKSIKKAMEADVAAGKGSKTHAELLAGIYRGAANSLPASLTAGELYTTLQKAIASVGIPAPAVALPTMRALIAAELNKRLPTESDKQLTLEDRNRITATFGAMADSLEAILK